MKRLAFHLLLIGSILLPDQGALAKMIAPHVSFAASPEDSDADAQQASCAPDEPDPQAADDRSDDSSLPDESHPPITNDPEQDSDTEEANRSHETSLEHKVSTDRASRPHFIRITSQSFCCKFTHLRF